MEASWESAVPIFITLHAMINVVIIFCDGFIEKVSRWKSTFFNSL